MSTADKLAVVSLNGQEETEEQKATAFWRESLYSGDDFILRPPKPYIVGNKEAGLIGVKDLGEIYGASGDAKSFVLIDLCYAGSLGRTFAGLFTIERPLTILYCTGEGHGGLPDRLRAAKEKFGCENVPFYVMANVPQLFQRDGLPGISSFLQAFPAIAKERELPETLDLIILDTFHNSTVGMNENSTQDAGIVLESMRQVRDALGCAVLIAHHSNKEGILERGSTAVRGALDFIAKTERVGPGSFTFNCSKNKDGAEWPAQAFMLAQRTDSVSVHWEGVDQRKASPFKSKEVIFELVPQDTTIEKRALISKAGTLQIGEKKALGFLAELLNEKRLFEHFKKRPKTNALVSIARFPQGDSL